MNEPEMRTEPVEPVADPGPKPWPFRSIRVEVTPDHVKRYFLNTPAAMDALLDHFLVTNPYTIDRFLDDHQEEFTEFVIYDMAGGAV